MKLHKKLSRDFFLSTCPNLLTLVKIADVPGAILQNLSISNVIKTGSSRRQLHLVRSLYLLVLAP